MELMRSFALIVLLLSGTAVGAELRQAEVCSDGSTHQNGYCPAVLSSPSCSQTGSTTGSCQASSDESDGTRYVCATSTASALTAAQIAACSGGTAVAGSNASETGSNQMGLTGLTTDAAHYGQFANLSPEGWYSNAVVSASFTPTSPGSDPYDLTGIPARFEAVEFATGPTTTNSVTVNNQTELNAALVSGNEVTVNAGSYSSISIGSGQTDIDLILSNSAVFSGGLTISNGQRIRVSGGVFQGGVYTFLLLDLANHITIDNVRFDNGGQFYTWNGNTPHHITIMNSTFDAPGSGYGLLTGPVQHMIIANTEFTNQGSTVAGMRLASPSNVIIIDSYLFSSGNRIFRWNGDDAAGDLLLIQDTKLESDSDHNLWLTPSSGGGPNALSRFEMHGSNYCAPSSGIAGAPFQMDGDVSPGIDDVIITNNNFYSPDSSVGGSSVTNYTNTPNTFDTYANRGTACNFSGGADH